MSFSNLPQSPTVETTTDRADALDWSTLPNEKCDLNYRPLEPRPRWASVLTVTFVVFGTLVMLPIVLLIHLYAGNAFQTATCFVISVLMGSTIGLTLHLLEQPTQRVLLGFAAPTLAWLLIIGAPFHRYPAGSVLLLHAFAIPLRCGWRTPSRRMLFSG